ncbi:MAG: hypothetical protein MR913_02220 [Clostridiales bacterium]|nr:hypothetical protein [Clostridiales bacterium]
MKGSIKVQVSNSHISFTLELERNITIICGDSATGKTTLIGMLRDYEENGRSSLYFSLEQYFTDLLIQLTHDTVLHYSKNRLHPSYLQSANVAKVLRAMQE